MSDRIEEIRRRHDTRRRWDQQHADIAELLAEVYRLRADLAREADHSRRVQQAADELRAELAEARRLTCDGAVIVRANGVREARCGSAQMMRELDAAHEARRQAQLSEQRAREARNRAALEVRRKEVVPLRHALAFAVREADGWHDDARGGPIQGEDMAKARALVADLMEGEA